MSDRVKFKPFHLDPKPHYGMNNESEAELVISKVYFNQSSLDISITHRNNVCVTLDKTLQQQYATGELIVRSEWRFRGNAVAEKTYKSVTDALQHHNIRTEELSMFAKRLKEFIDARPFASSDLSICFDRLIRARTIQENKFIYLHDDDILICGKENANRVLHPNSSEGITDASHYDFVSQSGMTGFFVEIVDNDRKIGNRFIYTGKRLIEVTPIEDMNRRDGVYYHVAENHPVAGIEIQKTFCPVEEASETIGLFRTKEEAMTGGNPENISKAELETLKHQGQRLQIEAEQLRSENVILKEKIERSKTEREDFYQEKKQVRNDHYEERSSARKDSGEVYKIAAAVVGTAVAMWFGMRK